MEAYPLTWPAGWKRTDAGRRRSAKFLKKSWDTGRKGQLTIGQATERVLDELRRFGIVRSSVIISSNLKLRADGLPYSDQKAPADPGVAVYWTQRSDAKVLAVDQYDRVADNLAAIAATLEAMRTIERHGGAVVLDRAFSGFVALPSPTQWRDVLGFAPDETVGWLLVKERYRQLAKTRHPDAGGSDEAMAQLNRAYDSAERELVPAT